MGTEYQKNITQISPDYQTTTYVPTYNLYLELDTTELQHFLTSNKNNLGKYRGKFYTNKKAEMEPLYYEDNKKEQFMRILN